MGESRVRYALRPNQIDDFQRSPNAVSTRIMPKPRQTIKPPFPISYSQPPPPPQGVSALPGLWRLRLALHGPSAEHDRHEDNDRQARDDHEQHRGLVVSEVLQRFRGTLSESGKTHVAADVRFWSLSRPGTS